MVDIISLNSKKSFGEDKNLENLKQICKSEKVVIAYGHFSSIHPGHIRYLQNAKDYGTKLTVVLIGDGNGDEGKKFPFTCRERSTSLALLNICDFIVELKDNELDLIIDYLSPSRIIFGTDYRNSKDENIIKAIKTARRINTSISYDSGETTYASTDLLKDSESSIDKKRKEQLIKACIRQSVKVKDLCKKIDQFKDTAILIIGDSIIDEYSACEALGMSSEAPVVVVKELDSELYVGGAAVVSLHINELGGNCHFVSVTGDDYLSDKVKNYLNEKNIKTYLFKDKSRPTTYKKRYMVENQKLFRVSKLEDKPISFDLEKDIIAEIETIIPQVKGIVISDFNYGVITSNILEAIRSLAKKYNVKVFADSQCSSQVGSVTKFNDIDLLCPNEREARISLQNKTSGIESLASQLFIECNLTNLLMKIGSQGFIAYQGGNNSALTKQHFPALSSNPVDVTGAGDSLISCMAVAISSGVSLMDASVIGTFISSIAVESIGNKPISSNTLKNKIQEYLKEYL